MIHVVCNQTGDKAEAPSVEGALLAARTLMEDAAITIRHARGLTVSFFVSGESVGGLASVSRPTIWSALGRVRNGGHDARFAALHARRERERAVGRIRWRRVSPLTGGGYAGWSERGSVFAGPADVATRAWPYGCIEQRQRIKAGEAPTLRAAKASAEALICSDRATGALESAPVDRPPVDRERKEAAMPSKTATKPNFTKAVVTGLRAELGRKRKVAAMAKKHYQRVTVDGETVGYIVTRKNGSLRIEVPNGAGWYDLSEVIQPSDVGAAARLLAAKAEQNGAKAENATRECPQGCGALLMEDEPDGPCHECTAPAGEPQDAEG